MDRLLPRVFELSASVRTFWKIIKWFFSFEVSPSFVCEKAKVKGREGERSDFLFLNFFPSLIYVRIGEVLNRTF
jgi:hypothetical protein